MNMNGVKTRREIERIGYDVIGAALDVHSALGPGLLESAYERCLAYDFGERGLSFQRQKSLPIRYKGVSLDCGYRLDFAVEDAVVVELKTVKTVQDIHTAQVLSYLKLGDWRLGLILNFNVTRMKYGIHRIVNNL
jgi:GxxExxY protein